MKEKIKIAKKFIYIIDMVVKTGICNNQEKAISFIFEEGVDFVNGDAEMFLESGTRDRPDCSFCFEYENTKHPLGPCFEGKLENIELPEFLIKKNQKKLNTIIEGITIRGRRISFNEAIAISFLMGLFESYSSLISTQLYKKDKNFRKKVDNMPHDLALELHTDRDFIF